VPNSAWSCSLKIGACTSLRSQESATAPRPNCSIRLKMPLTAPFLCMKSTTSLRNASLVDCPHNDGKCVERFTTIAQEWIELECSERNRHRRNMNTLSLLYSWVRSPVPPRGLSAVNSRNGESSIPLTYITQILRSASIDGPPTPTGFDARPQSEVPVLMSAY
jgi:hypothetical protein